ncbi:type IV pilin protein [Acinetobacter sp. WCHAc010052]|uniref:type IV pilin protein n=1 Tax=Acinetobacter sp. WCHAc010052 TaxID=2004647 RepID=UPI00148C622D|nr:type IV pilin protein [Acinetobacter sp. WCHAc010052]
MVMRLYRGFTLIELMIVVAIIAILAAIAYPSYQEYVRKTKRAEMQSEMMSIATNLQSYRAINHNYTGAKLSNSGLSQSFPATGTANYTLNLSVAAQTWTLTAQPQNGQAGNGHLVLNNLGHKCWTKGSDDNSGSACAPTALTSWDGR